MLINLADPYHREKGVSTRKRLQCKKCGSVSRERPGKGWSVLLLELVSLRFSGPSAGSLSCSLRAVSKLAALKQSILLFLSFAEASNASEPNFRSDTPAPLPPSWAEGAS